MDSFLHDLTFVLQRFKDYRIKTPKLYPSWVILFLLRCSYAGLECFSFLAFGVRRLLSLKLIKPKLGDSWFKKWSISFYLYIQSSNDRDL